MRFGPRLPSTATVRTALAVRAAAVAVLAPLAVLAACGDEASPPWGSEATGSIKGGESLVTSVECNQTGAACQTWSYLYACYFGPNASGHAGGCAANAACHQIATGAGTATSGFLCGLTKDSCWQGMTDNTINPLLPTLVKSKNALTLYNALYQDGSDAGLIGTDNMPPSTTELNAPPFMPGFTKGEMACIKGWVAAGAQND
jgi:hypothetical protein